MIELWNEAFLEPMLNFLIVLYSQLFNNFGIAVIVFTIAIRLVTLPLTLKQLHSTKAITSIQPKMQELQKKYGKDKQKLAQEQMKLYKEMGANPLGCLVPTIIQFPIWIALYQSIQQALAASPEDLLGLSQRLYSWPLVNKVVPLDSQFLWLDLAQPDKFLILPVLVGLSMWVQQKMITTATNDPRQQSMSNMMMWMMPMMFGVFSLQFASGLAIYWVVFNIIGIVVQYFVTGWGGLLKTTAILPLPEAKGGGRSGNGQRGSERQDRGRSGSARPGETGREDGGGGGSSPKKG